jgi:hypothetical protein
MGARKYLNVATPPYQTGVVTTGADITVGGFKIWSAANGGTAKTNILPLDTNRTLSAGGRLEMADNAIYMFRGVAGTAGQVPDAILQAELDYTYADTDYIEWFAADMTTSLTSRFTGGRTAVGDWDAASTF